MSRAEEFQKEYGKILNEEGYEYPGETICSYHSLVEDMIETIKKLEKEASEKSEAMRLELEVSAKRH